MPKTRKRNHRGGVEPQQVFKDAIKENDIESVQRLLQDPRVDPAAEEGFALVWAGYKGNTEVARILLQDPRVDPSVRDSLAFSYACEYGSIPIVQMLLQDPRVDPSAETQRPLKMACENGKTEVVQLLLQDPRVDPSVDNQEALQKACEYGRLSIVEILLQDPRVDPTTGENEALLVAAKNEQVNVVKRLLQDPRVYKSDYIYEWPVKARWNKKLKGVFATAKSKRNIREKARNTLSLRQAERVGFKTLPNNVKGYLGTFLSGKTGPTLQSHMNQLKKNHNNVRNTKKKIVYRFE